MEILKKRKVITITQKGYKFTGTANLQLWGGGKGDIPMKDVFIPFDNYSRENVMRCVNDNGHGCEKILGAEIHIYIVYDNNSTEYLEELEPTEEDRQYFNGWRELQAEGIYA